MTARMVLTGDVNLMNVTDPAVPFSLVADEFHAADIVFCNLECCLCQPPSGHSVEHEGFLADPVVAGKALQSAGIQSVGLANNVNYGEAAIMASIARLDELGIAHTGAGADSPGMAVIRGHTAYHAPMHGSRPPANRPGIPPEIVTWADLAYLQWLGEDIAALREQADVVVASFHWGLQKEVLQYMTEIAYRAIDAGADLVIGHGPHYSLPIEVYKNVPIFYGLGSFSFHTGHGGRMHGDWLGMMVRASWEGGRLAFAAFQFVRHDRQNRTILCKLADEGPAFDEIARRSHDLGARLTARGDEVEIELRT